MLQYSTSNRTKNRQNANLFDNIQWQGDYLSNIGGNPWNVFIFTAQNQI